MDNSLKLLVDYYKSNPDKLKEKGKEYGGFITGGATTGGTLSYLARNKRLPNPLAAAPTYFLSAGLSAPFIDSYGMAQRLKNKEELI